MNALGQQYAEHGVVILAVSVDASKTKYQQFIQANEYSSIRWARDSSGEIAKLYRVSGVPMTYLIDRLGVIRYTHVGYGSSMEHAFAQQIESLLE